MTEKPFAGCPLCGDPLVQTFEFKKKEWICMGCLKVWEYLSAKSIPASAAVRAKYDQYKAKYDQERAERAKAGTLGVYHKP